MSGPNWPVRRYEIIVKKGGAPLGLKLHQTKSRRGVYANGFAEGPYPPPGPQACMRVGDVLVSVDGKSVEGATLPVALAAIETARRRDRLRDFITAKQDDPRKGNVVMVFERVSPRLTFRDIALDPRKVVYLLNYMLEVRCAGTGGVGGSSSSSGGGDGRKETVIISLDEARLMFWLEVQVLFEMSAVMAPSRDDMSKVYDKFFRPGSGFYVHELTDTRQAKIRTRRSWDGDVSGLPSVGRKADSSANTAKEVAQPQPQAAASSGSGSGGVVSTAGTDPAASSLPGVGGGGGLDASTTASAAAGDGQEGKGGGGGGNVEAVEPPSSADPPPAPAARSSTEGGGSDVSAKHGAEAGENGTREGSGGTKPAVGAGDWVSLPVEFLAADLSKIFRASQEKVEETLTAGCFYRFKTSPWKGRMVAHLSNSPDFVHVPFEIIMAEQELRDVMMLHMIITQTPGWLQVWREIELTVKPRMALLQTRRSVRHRRGSALSSRSNGTIRRHSASDDWERTLSSSMSSSSSSSSSNNNINVRVGTSTPSLSRSSSFSPPSPDMRELKAAAAVAIVASAVYLWDFFLSADSHASLGVARDTNAYVTLKQLLAENVPGDKMGGPGAGDASSGDGPGTQKGRDAGDDYAVSVGKALLDMQRHVLRKLCASVYPDFQASSSHEHLCAELTTGTRSPARLPPGPPDQLDFDPAPSQQQRDSIGGGAPLPPPPQGPTHAARRGTSAAVSPPRQVRAPPPLRQKMLLQQQQQQQGGGSEVGAGDKASSASPFAFLGGGTPPSDGERKAVTAGNSHARRSSAPGISPTGVASRGAGIGEKSGPGRVDPFPPEEDAPRVSDRAGRVQGVSGPQFEPLWRASRGWVLEKVMRRVELPPHVSRHRPPWDNACQQGRRGEKGAVGTGRSSSGTAPPDLRQHLSLPRTARRLGRRPSYSSGSLVPGEPTEEADSSAGVGGSTHAGGGGVAGDLDVASPPDVLGSRSGFGVQETQGIEPGPTGAREDRGGGVVGEGIRGCAEWAVSFSGSLQQGITTVQTEHAVCVAPRNLGLDVPPEGLEAFYCPCLPASGEAPRACPALGGGKSSGVGKGGRGSGGSRGRCFGPGVPPPPPRLFTFAAPGRSGAGIFYGACLSVFRPVSQWVGGEPAAGVAARGINRSSSNSPPPCLTTTAATATATTTTALDTQRPLVEEESKARIDGIMGGASSRTETASRVDDGAATAASVGEERAPSRLSGVGDVSGVLDGEEQAVDDRARGNMGDNKAPAEEVAIEGEDLGQLNADGGVSSTVGRETDSGVVEDAVLDDATEGREAAAVDAAAATAQKKKEAANTTTLDKTPSMLEMLKLKKGMGIFGKSSSLGQNKVSPSPTSTAPMSSLPPSVATTEVAPESDTEELRVEVDGQGADETTGGLEGSGGTGAVAKTKATAAAAASPSMMDLSSRFRLGMGMFGSGKASPRVVTGSGFSPKLGTQAAAAATAAAAASTISPAAGSAPVEASPTPSSSSGGVGKFSSYARRAGNFLGSDSRGVGRSPRPTQPPPSPDVLPNGPPPPSPLVPVYLSSPPPEAEDAVLGHSEATAVAAAAGAMDVASDVASRQLSDSAASQGGGRNKHKRSLSDVPPADAASAAAAAAVVDANELASAASSGVGDASKGRSMSAASSGVGSSSSSSGSGPGTQRQGESADGSGGNGRQKHTFFVASGVCLLSTRPEIGAMRRALAAYWAAHGDEILARGSTAEGGAAAAHAGGEGPALAARESGGGGGGGSNDHGHGGSDGEVAEAPSEGSGEVEDEEEQEEKKHVGAWTEMDPSTLRDVLVPFVTQERRDEKYKEGQAHRYDKERRRSAGASQDRTSAADVLTKSFSAGSLGHPGQSSGATHGQGDRAEAGGTTEGGVDMSAVAHEDGSGFGLDFDPSVVFRCLSPRNLCLVMLALLCERKVVLVSSRLSLLTQAGEVFRSLLQPLSWSHVYVPLLPRKMAADLLQCPTPFILGLESVTARELELPRDAIQVHLDTDYLCVPKDFLGLAPMSVVCSRISSVLNPGVDDLDCPSSVGAGADAGGVWAAGTARTIRFLFREFISELLQGATESTFRVGQGSTATILLDEHLYKRAKASAAKTAELFYDDQRRSSGRGGAGHGLHEQQYPGPLYNRHCGLLLDQFVKTQMLSHFLSEGGSE